MAFSESFFQDIFPNNFFEQTVFVLIFIVHINYHLKKNLPLAKSGLLRLSICVWHIFCLKLLIHSESLFFQVPNPLIFNWNAWMLARILSVVNR